jgi:hypothetical protein
MSEIIPKGQCHLVILPLNVADFKVLTSPAGTPGIVFARM